MNGSLTDLEQASAILLSLSLRVPGLHVSITTTGFLCGYLGFELRSLCLHSKYPHFLNQFPSPRATFLELFFEVIALLKGPKMAYWESPYPPSKRLAASLTITSLLTTPKLLRVAKEYCVV